MPQWQKQRRRYVSLLACVCACAYVCVCGYPRTCGARPVTDCVDRVDIHKLPVRHISSPTPVVDCEHGCWLLGVDRTKFRCCGHARGCDPDRTPPTTIPRASIPLERLGNICFVVSSSPPPLPVVMTKQSYVLASRPFSWYTATSLASTLCTTRTLPMPRVCVWVRGVGKT
jgi:hypothetical protein